jgi:uncharacterized membrane protein YhiD involved in acid resistance
MGIVCGLGAWIPAVVAFCLVFLLLIGGGGLERWLHRVWVGKRPEKEGSPADLR